MKRGGGPPLIELAVPTYGVLCGKALDRNAAPLQFLDRRPVRPQATVGTDAHDQPLGQLLQHILNVLEHQRVPLAPPPIGHDAVGQDDHVTPLLQSVDTETAEAVVREPCHGVRLPRR